MLRKIFSLILVTTLIVLGYCFLANDGRLIGIQPPGSASIHCPRQLDLGKQRVGTVAIASLPIRNEGMQTLHIDQIRIGCSCAGIQRDRDTASETVETLEIPPQEERILYVRVTIQGESRNLINLVTFRTNDPSNPEIAISVAISLPEFYSLPKMVNFGKILVGEQARERIEVFYPTASPRRVVDAKHSLSDRMKVLVHHMDSEGQGNRSGPIARIELKPSTEVPILLDGELLVSFDDGEELRIPTYGRVRNPIEISPSTVTFSASRKNDSPTSCVLRSTNNDPIRISDVEAPSSLKVSIAEEDSPSPKICIRYVPDSVRTTGFISYEVRFTAIQSKKRYPLTIRVVIYD